MTQDNKNPYQYCTKCGGEIEDELKAAYFERDAPDIPPFCRTCFSEIFTGLKEAMKIALETQEQQMRIVLEHFSKMLEHESENV